jgi:tellurite resistance protein TerC
MFHYLKTGISILLAFIGFKLLFHSWLDDIGYKSIYSLYFILIILAGSILLSVIHPKKAITASAE